MKEHYAGERLASRRGMPLSWEGREISIWNDPWIHWNSGFKLVPNDGNVEARGEGRVSELMEEGIQVSNWL